MKKAVKLVTLPLLAILLSGSISPSISVMAESNSNIVYQEPKESDYQYLREQRSIWTKVAKTVIRKAIKNKSLVVSAVRNTVGKTVANQVDKYFTTIASSLTPLLNWTEIPAQAVQDAVYRGLVNSGVSSSTATEIAHAIKEVLSWVI
ncbi:hypothetical protein [Streptococcus suis]|uniref:Uncharacterized protein n=1 Tax=Streptococcus suis TaxID=1307 RepID=A0ACD4UM92_STRSU